MTARKTQAQRDEINARIRFKSLKTAPNIIDAFMILLELGVVERSDAVHLFHAGMRRGALEERHQYP